MKLLNTATSPTLMIPLSLEQVARFEVSGERAQPMKMSPSCGIPLNQRRTSPIVIRSARRHHR